MEGTRETARQRVADRARRLWAALMAALLALATVPVAPAMAIEAVPDGAIEVVPEAEVEPEAAGDSYYLVVARYYQDMLFGQAQESGEAHVLDKIDGNYSGGYRNSYVEYDTEQNPTLFHGINL